MGIEPTSAAWEAAILPLNHARSRLPYQTYRDFGNLYWSDVCGVYGPAREACSLHRGTFLTGFS